MTDATPTPPDASQGEPTAPLPTMPLPAASEQTVPLVPQAGYTQPLPSLNDTTVDPFGGTASDRGLEWTDADAASYPATRPLAWKGTSGQQGTPATPQPTNYVQPSAPYQPFAEPAKVEPAPTSYSTYASYPGYPQAQPAPLVQQVPYGYGYSLLPDHPNSTLTLVLGLVSVLGFPLTGPFAWVIGSRARSELRQHPGRWGASGSLTVGWVLGIISTSLMLAALISMTLFVLIMAGFAMR